MLTAYHPHRRERRTTGLALTLLVHAALLLGWQMSRPLPAPDSGPELARPSIQWIRLPPPIVPRPRPEPVAPPRQAAAPPARAAAPPAPRLPRLASPPAAVGPTAQPAPAAAAPAAAAPAASAPAAQAPAAQAPAAPAPTAGQPATAQPADAPPAMPAARPDAPSAADILRGAKRDIGKIDRALRKENNPYIVAPPDSPAIRMRDRMQTAHDLAPPRPWEAPKIEALVNDTGDGARRERVITGRRTYCVTDRGINTSIDMIEKHGKQRITTCPQHELPASHQAWRTARD